jgi:hypothetical protein
MRNTKSDQAAARDAAYHKRQEVAAAFKADQKAEDDAQGWQAAQRAKDDAAFKAQSAVPAVFHPAPFMVPALAHDIMMQERFGTKVSPTGRLERRIVAHLIDHVTRSGFALHSVNDGDEITPVATMQEAMEVIFNLDEASLRFYKGGPKGATQAALERDDWHGVLLVLGNGVDIVSDWNYSAGDADGFGAAMEVFDAEQYA